MQHNKNNHYTIQLLYTISYITLLSSYHIYWQIAQNFLLKSSSSYLVYSRDETILQYIDNCNIYYCNTIQYGLKEISIYCTLQYIVIYCNVCCLNVINTPLLHHKNDWASKNLDHTLQFLMLLHGYTGCMFFILLPKPIFLSFYQNSIKYCNMAIYCNTLIHNTDTALTCIVSPLVYTSI